MPQYVSDEFDLADYRWTHRPLIVFGKGDLVVEQQKHLDAAKGKLADREMLVVYVEGDAGGRVWDPSNDDGRSLTGTEAKKLLDAHSVKAGEFALLLVGKDGGEKRRETSPTPLQPIFDQIDSMPMRQQEMRQDGDQR